MIKVVDKSKNGIYNSNMELVDSFSDYSSKNLDFDKPVTVEFIDDEKNAKNPLGATAYYNPNQSKITIYVTGRHIKDILRSISHELIHHVQHCRGDLTGLEDTSLGYAQRNDHMANMEAEAYKKGNILNFRNFEDLVKQEIQRGKKMDALQEKRLKKLNSLLTNNSILSEQIKVKTKNDLNNLRRNINAALNLLKGLVKNDDPTDVMNTAKQAYSEVVKAMGPSTDIIVQLLKLHGPGDQPELPRGFAKELNNGMPMVRKNLVNAYMALKKNKNIFGREADAFDDLKGDASEKRRVVYDRLLSDTEKGMQFLARIANSISMRDTGTKYATDVVSMASDKLQQAAKAAKTTQAVATTKGPSTDSALEREKLGSQVSDIFKQVVTGFSGLIPQNETDPEYRRVKREVMKNITSELGSDRRRDYMSGNKVSRLKMANKVRAFITQAARG
tara:strand:+ start:1195 stop:2532 length:1338 start_codon:yes stop_codon:yes gene_type:complete